MVPDGQRVLGRPGRFGDLEPPAAGRKGGPAGGDKTLWKKTTIGNKVSIGSNATILPVNICDNVVIGAGAVVTKNINEPGVYAGNPAKLIRKI